MYLCRTVFVQELCRVDCLGEADKVFSQKTMKLLYSITNKDITNTVMQLGRERCIYLFIAVQKLTGYSSVCFYCIFSCLFFVLFSSSDFHLLYDHFTVV